MEFVSRDLAKADDLENDGVEIHFALVMKHAQKMSRS